MNRLMAGLCLLCCILLISLQGMGCAPCNGHAAPPPVEPGELQAATVGEPFEVQFSVTGASADNLARSLTGKLPKGLSFDATTGKLSGTPTETGEFFFEVHIALKSHKLCGGSATSGSYTLIVKEKGSQCSGHASPPRISPSELETARINVPLKIAFSAPGASLEEEVWTLTGSLPNGLRFDAAKAELSGEPLERGTFTFTLKVTLKDAGELCAAQPGVQEYTLVVE